MDPESSDARLAREIAPGERLLWSGRPRQGLLFRPADLFLVPFSLLWCGFAVFWEIAAFSAKAPPFFRFFGIPFVLAGLYFVFGRFLADALQRGRTRYAVTSSRLLVVSGLMTRTVESVPLRNLPQLALTTRADGSGDIRFGPPSPFGMPNIPGWPGMKAFSPLAFEGIPGARQVHDLIQRAQGETP